MKMLLALATLAATVQVSANGLRNNAPLMPRPQPVQITFKATFGENDQIKKEFCKEELKIMVTSRDLGLPLVREFSGPSVQLIDIQDSSFTVGADEKTQVTTRAFIVKSDMGPTYPKGVYELVTLTLSGPQNMMANTVTVSTKALNHLESAEVAEGSGVCNGIEYTR